MSLGSSYKGPGASATCYQSPSGLTSSDESDAGSPRFSFLAPSGYTGVLFHFCCPSTCSQGSSSSYTADLHACMAGTCLTASLFGRPRLGQRGGG